MEMETERGQEGAGASEHLRIVQTEVLSRAHYLLRRFTYDRRCRDGSWQRETREAYDRGDGAAILLYDAQRRTVILTRQFRLPSYINGNEDGMLIEACAGLLDGDAPDDCIRKESEEETGYRVGAPEKVFELYMSPGAVTERLHFYIAAIDEGAKLHEGGGMSDEQEDIEVLELPFEEAISMVRDGRIRDAKTVILLQYMRMQGLL